MTVEPCGTYITLEPHTDDELELVACIVDAIRAGGYIQVKSQLGATRLIFDGDPSQKPAKRKRATRKDTA